MARSVQVHLLDDLDGSAADETVSFAVDGVEYEIDLSAGNAEQLRASLARYIVAGRRIPRSHTPRAMRSGIARVPARTDREQNQAVRAWAKANNIELSSYGRIPRGIIEQYQATAGH